MKLKKDIRIASLFGGLWILCIMQFLIVSAGGSLVVADETGSDWIRKEKFRATLGLANLDQIKHVKKYGLNAVCDYVTTYDLEKVKQHSMEAKRLGLHYYVAFVNFHRWREVPRADRDSWLGDYRKMVNSAGEVYGKTPDPFSEEYWRGHFLPWALKIAAIKNAGYPIDGFLVDFEMYDADFTIYHSRCFCRPCFEYFIKHEKIELNIDELKPAEYATWLGKTGNKKQYYQLQQEKMLRIVSNIRKEIHSVCPTLQFGFYPHEDTWFFDALIDGLGTKEVPVIAMSEYTYGFNTTRNSSTYSKYFRKFMERDNVLFVSGLWFNLQPATQMAANAYDLARQTDGCWFYPFEILEKTPQQAIVDPRARDSRDAPAIEYLEAMKTFSQELDKWLADPSYDSPLAFKGEAKLGAKALPDAQTHRVVEAIVIDGKLDDRGWQSADEIRQPFLTTPDISYTDPERHGKGKPTRYSTSVKIAYDNENIYFGFVLNDPHLEQLTTRHQPPARDNGGVYNDDSLEIFLDVIADVSNGRRDRFYQFIVNSAAYIYDGYSKSGGTVFGDSVDTSWDAAGVVVASQKVEGAWTVEIKLPFADMGTTIPRDGEVWLVNFCRNKRSGGQDGAEQSFWSGPPGYHDRDCFAPLMFKGDR